MAGALNGLRVLDCTHVIAGAWCSLLLADLGADVIKIEPLDGEITRGDPERAFRPFDFVNRNKRAIAIDLNRPEGAAVLQRLADGADIFVENYRPGVLARLGLGYADLSRRNPRLIYCSISGFGHSGPYAQRGGFDLIAQAMSGIMSFTGLPGAVEPSAAGVPLSDLNAGLFGALGVLAAVQERHGSGLGQHVEATLFESALSYTLWEMGLYLTEQSVAEPVGSRHRLAAPYEALPTADGHIVVGVNNARLWNRFCTALEAQELHQDSRFAGAAERVANRGQLRDELTRRLASATTEVWMARLVANGVPCGPINTIAEAAADPHVQARGYFQDVEGRRFPRTPITLDRTPVTVCRGAPAIGADTRAVLAECGLAGAEIEALLRQGVVGSQEEYIQ